MNQSSGQNSAQQTSIKVGGKPNEKFYNSDAVLSVAEYRKILGDSTSSDERIKQRIQFLEAFCGNIIRLELKKYAK